MKERSEAGRRLLVVQEEPLKILATKTVGPNHWYMTRVRHDSELVYPSSQCSGVVLVGLVVEEIDQEVKKRAEEQRLGGNPNKANRTHYGSNSLLARTQCSCGELVEADRVKIRLMIPLEERQSISPRMSQS